MKSIKKEDFMRIREALAGVYREKEKTKVGELWQTKVMGHIKSLGPLHSELSFYEVFQRLLWRIAPVACVLALLLGIAVTQLDVVLDYELTKMFMEDPVDFSLPALYMQ